MKFYFKNFGLPKKQTNAKRQQRIQENHLKKKKKNLSRLFRINSFEFSLSQ